MKLRISIALASIFFLLFVHCAETPSVVSSGSTSPLSLSLPQEPTTASGKKSCSLSKTKRALRIAGATLLGVGAASLITGGVLWSLDRKETGDTCFVGARPDNCIWKTRTGGGIAMGLGAAGMLGGGFMLGYSFIPGKSDGTCK